MTHTFRPATREGTQLIIGSIGASGSGKTYSLFEIATGLAYPEASNADELAAIIAKEGRNRIVSIDTERGRALHYAPPPGQRPDPWKQGAATFAFDHAELHPPFSPQAYQDMVEAADDAGYQVIIVDSGSHEWAGEGGILEMFEADQYERAKRKANWNNRDGTQREPSYQDLEAVKMSAWIKPKMAHKKLVGRLTTLRAHLLIALRGEEKVHMEKDPNNPKKTVVVQAADLPPNKRWTPICEKSFPFELTMSFVLEPDRPGFPIPLKLQEQHREYVPLDRPLSIETGRRLAGWAGGTASGPGVAPPASKPAQAEPQKETQPTGKQQSDAERIADKLKTKIRDSSDVAALKTLWDSAASFRAQLEERDLTTILQSCQDAYDLRLDELSRSDQFAMEDE